MADLSGLIAELRTAAEDQADPFAWFEAASRSSIQVSVEGEDRFVKTSEVQAFKDAVRAALPQKDKADE